MTDPTPVYPHSLLWRRDNPHPPSAPTSPPQRPATTGLGDSALNAAITQLRADGCDVRDEGVARVRPTAGQAPGAAPTGA